MLTLSEDDASGQSRFGPYFHHMIEKAFKNLAIQMKIESVLPVMKAYTSIDQKKRRLKQHIPLNLKASIAC